MRARMAHFGDRRAIGADAPNIYPATAQANENTNG